MGVSLVRSGRGSDADVSSTSQAGETPDRRNRRETISSGFRPAPRWSVAGPDRIRADDADYTRTCIPPAPGCSRGCLNRAKPPRCASAAIVRTWGSAGALPIDPLRGSIPPGGSAPLDPRQGLALGTIHFGAGTGGANADVARSWLAPPVPAPMDRFQRAPPFDGGPWGQRPLAGFRAEP